MNLEFCPKLKNTQVLELNPKLVLSKIGKVNLLNIKHKDKIYKVDISGIKYHILKKQQRCQCCSVRLNRAFLEIDKQNSNTDKTVYLIAFYAQTLTHLVLMTRDHIIPKSKCGQNSIDNAQTLCYNCNCIKSDTSLTLKQIRGILFPAYRAYRSSVGINKSKPKTQKLRDKIKRNKIAIKNITNGLTIVKDERVHGMKLKLSSLKKETKKLKKEVEEIEIFSQTNIC